MKSVSVNDTHFRLPWLIFLSCVLGVALALPPGFETLWPESGIPIPVCPFRTITGIPCPLCGMTRSFVLSAHLEFSAAIVMNPAGFFLFFYLLSYLAAGWLSMFSGQPLLNRFLKYQALWLISFVILFSWSMMILLVWEGV